MKNVLMYMILFLNLFTYPLNDHSESVSVTRSYNEEQDEVIYNIRNVGDETLWLWLSREDVSHKNDSVKIRHYMVRPQCEWDLFRIICDGSVMFHSVLFDTWFKLLPPNEAFSLKIVDFGKGGQTAEKVVEFVDARLNIILSSQVVKWRRITPDDVEVKRFSDKADSLTLKWEDLQKGITKEKYLTVF